MLTSIVAAALVIGAIVLVQTLASRESGHAQTKPGRCYDTATTDFRLGHDFNGIMIAAPPRTLGLVVAPIRACSEAWEKGVLGRRLRIITDPGQIVDVPHMVGCVLPDRTPAVFPGYDGTCQHLGLPTALPG
jgi:hypothetical protein